MDGALFMSLYTERHTNLLIFCSIFTDEGCLRITAGAIFERAGGQYSLVARTHPEIVRIVILAECQPFYMYATFPDWAAIPWYTPYTKARADMWRTFARQPQLVLTNFLMILFLVFSLFFTSSRYWLNINALYSLIPKYFRASSPICLALWNIK